MSVRRSSLRPLLPTFILLCAAASGAPGGPSGGRASSGSATALEGLARWLELEPGARPLLQRQDFARAPLTRGDASTASARLWQDHVKRASPELRAEWEEKVVRVGKHAMKFEYRTFGDRPGGGWDLHVALHGGGGAPAHVNESQWRNHIRLYRPKDSLYVVPRAPTDNWNLWHEPHVDPLLARVIEGAVLVRGANPDRVYISGYSAGGDGVYQLAPRMADRLAAAAAMAGHPNNAEPHGLRNIGFTVHVGEKDGAYNRNKVALEWKRMLADLRAADPGGYSHEVVVHEGLGHWVNGRDAAAMDWMARFTRDPLPERVVWRQGNVVHPQFYWLEAPPGERKAHARIVAERSGQTVTLSGAHGLGKVIVLLNDEMLDLDRDVIVRTKDATLFEGRPPRTIATIARTLENKKDRGLLFAAEVAVTVD